MNTIIIIKHYFKIKIMFLKIFLSFIFLFLLLIFVLIYELTSAYRFHYYQRNQNVKKIDTLIIISVSLLISIITTLSISPYFTFSFLFIIFRNVYPDYNKKVAF